MSKPADRTSKAAKVRKPPLIPIAPPLRPPEPPQIPAEYQAAFEAAGQALAALPPSAIAGDLDWHHDDPAWQWLDAVYEAEQLSQPARLIRLLGIQQVPPNAMPYVADLLARKLVPKQRGKQPRALWDVSDRERLARLVALVRQEAPGLSVRAAVEHLVGRLKDSPSAWEYAEREALIAYCSGRTGHSRRMKKRRK